jgi:hypothetical protein
LARSAHDLFHFVDGQSSHLVRKGILDIERRIILGDQIQFLRLAACRRIEKQRQESRAKV